MAKPVNLRADMPTTAAFIDECRAAFGVDVVNKAIRLGVNGLPGFWACENGIEVGTKMPEPIKFICSADMVIRPETKNYLLKKDRK
jgi:hypothetical protein